MSVLEKMKVWLSPEENLNDAVLQAILDRAKAKILEYCNLDNFPEGLTETQVEIAVKYYRRMGADGETSRAEGGISQSFDEVMTADIYRSLNTYRKLRW